MRKYCFILLILIIIPINVYANIICNDGTMSPSCADCHRGCCSRHGGCSSSSTNSNSSGGYGGSGYSSNPAPVPVPAPTPTPTPIPKSSDTSLKEVVLDGNKLEIKDVMEANLEKEETTLLVTLNDTKASAEYESNLELKHGDNEIIILVTAENGDKKEYKIIIHNKLLSDNKNFKLFYNEKELKINEDIKTIEDIIVESSIEKINFTSKLEDKKAKISFQNNDKLDYGNNSIKIIITAEDDSFDEYKLNVFRKYKTNNKVTNNKTTSIKKEEKADNSDNIIGFLGVSTVSVLSGFGIIHHNRKKKSIN